MQAADLTQGHGQGQLLTTNNLYNHLIPKTDKTTAGLYNHIIPTTINNHDQSGSLGGSVLGKLGNGPTSPYTSYLSHAQSIMDYVAPMFGYHGYRPLVGSGVVIPPEGFPKNTCHYCGVVKQGPAALERHLRKHTGCRPFVCQVCNKAFKAKRSLQYHYYMNHDPDQSNQTTSVSRHNVNPNNPLTALSAPPASHDQGSTATTASADMTPAPSSGSQDKHGGQENMETDNSSGQSSPYGGDTSSGGDERDSRGAYSSTQRDSYQRQSVISENFSSNPPDSSTSALLSCDNNGNLTSSYSVKESEQERPPSPKYLRSRTRQRLEAVQKGDGSSQDCSTEAGGEASQVTMCPYCHKTFPKPSDMKRHLMVHTGEKPFRCHICQQGFKAKGSMQYHLKAAHSIDIELSPGLEERYLRSRVNADQRRLDRLRQRMERKNWSNDDSQEGPTEGEETQQDTASSAALDLSATESLVHSQVSSTPREMADTSGIQSYDPATFYAEMERYRTWTAEMLDKAGYQQYQQLLHQQQQQEEGKVTPDKREDMEKSPDTLNNNRPERLESKPCTDTSQQVVAEGTKDTPVQDTDTKVAQPQILDHNANVDSEDPMLTVDFPSNFPGLRKKFQIRNETVLVSRMEGTNISTGDPVTLYKCYLCSKVFQLLSRLQCHLSMHYERSISLYQCPKCGASFKFRVQLRRHMRLHKGAPYYTHRPRSLSDSFEFYSDRLSYLDSPDVIKMSLQGAAHSNSDAGSRDGESKGDLSLKSEFDVSNENSPATVVTQQDDSSSLRSERSEQESTTERESGGLVTSGSTPSLTKFGLKGYGPFLNMPKYMYQKMNGMYVCRYCNKCFDRFFSLQRHERVHTGFKPCYCHECGKGFSEPRNLRHHLVRFHANSPQLGMVKRTRSTKTSGLTRSSQRLAPVTPDMIAKANQSKSPPPMSTSKLEHLLSSVKDTRTEDTRENVETEASTPTDLSTHHSQRYTEEGKHPAATYPSSSKAAELADEIREKERLDEDVTVVIPSDAPITTSVAGGDGTGSALPHGSETASWGAEIGSDPESDSSHSNEIASAPWSIMAYKQQMKAKRKSLPQRLSSPHAGAHSPNQANKERQTTASTATVSSEQQDPRPSSPPDIKPALSLPFTMATTSSAASSPVTSVPMAMPFSSLLPVSSTAAAASLLGMAPQMYLGATTAFHPSLLPPYLPSLASTTGLLPPPGIKMESLSLGVTSASSAWPTAERSSPETSVPTATASATASSAYSRSSSLSRSHSRLNVVRTPIRRDDACKPTLLPDGRTVYRCSYCAKDFGSFSDINRHMDFHEGNKHLDIRPYKCKFCDYYARTNSQLKVHMMRHQGIREFHCKLCNYKGVTQSDLNRHMKSQIHMMKAQNECRLCGEGFVSPKNLEKHLAHCQGPKSSE